MITLMALSLCVGLLIDDAIVVRENIVRHVQMGKSAAPAALEGTQEIGLAVLATTLSIVAVFLPIGFMGGIIGKFFHEFGITIVAAVLISMFVSFTLDPMLSSVWHDPAIDAARPTAGRPRHALRPHHRPRDRLVRRASPSRLARRLPAHPRAGAGAPAGHCSPSRSRSSSPASSWCRCSAPSSCPRPTSPKRTVNFYTPVGSSLEVTEAKARQVEARAARLARGALHLHDHQHRQRAGQELREHLRAAGRPQGPRSRSVDQMSAVLRERLRAHARHHGHARRPARLGRRQQADRVLDAGPRPGASWSGCRSA